MSYGLLFDTTSPTSPKLLNRLLLHLRDIEFGSGDAFQYVTHKDAIELHNLVQHAWALTPTVAPIGPNISNSWANATIEEVEVFNLEVGKSLFLLLDEQGAREMTIIVAQQQFYGGENDDDDDDDHGENDEWKEFWKARVPWEEAYIMWANLNIANLHFKDYCEEPAEGNQSNWLTWRDIGKGRRTFEEPRAKRDEKIKKLEDQGLA